MKVVKRLSAATVYLDKPAGSNAKFYIDIQGERVDMVFDSQADAERFIEDWHGTDDSTAVEYHVVDSGHVQARAPKG